MVTDAVDGKDLASALAIVNELPTLPMARGGIETYACPWCGLDGLTEDVLWRHKSLYHANEKNPAVACPVCREDAATVGRLAVHLHNAHGPPSRGEVHNEWHNRPHPLYAFALCVVRRERQVPTHVRYLII
jgi:hypothetical protein